MPGHLDSDLYCQQWVRLSMLWEDLVSNFHIISEAIYSPIIVSLFSMGFCLYCHHCAAAVATSDTDRALSGSLCCSNSEATVQIGSICGITKKKQKPNGYSRETFLL
jgi:hypothetical protein